MKKEEREGKRKAIKKPCKWWAAVSHKYRIMTVFDNEEEARARAKLLRRELKSKYVVVEIREVLPPSQPARKKPTKAARR